MVRNGDEQTDAEWEAMEMNRVERTWKKWRWTNWCRAEWEEMEMNRGQKFKKAQFMAAGGACKATFCISVAFNFSQWTTKFSQHTLNPLAKLYTTALPLHTLSPLAVIHELNTWGVSTSEVVQNTISCDDSTTLLPLHNLNPLHNGLASEKLHKIQSLPTTTLQPLPNLNPLCKGLALAQFYKSDQKDTGT